MAERKFRNSLAGLALVTLLASGCATTSSNVQTTDNNPNQKEEQGYLAKCYSKTGEKLWTGLTSPFLAAWGVVSYDYTCPGSHEHGGCEYMPPMIMGAIGGVALIVEGAWNLLAVPLPLPSAAPYMRSTVQGIQEGFDQMSGHRDRSTGICTLKWRSDILQNFYKDYKD